MGHIEEVKEKEHDKCGTPECCGQCDTATVKPQTQDKEKE